MIKGPCLLLLLFCSAIIHAQTLGLKDLPRAIDFQESKKQKFLVQKKFVFALFPDTLALGEYKFFHPQNKDTISILYDLVYEKEGGYHAFVKYTMRSAAHRNIFIRSLKANGYSYSKRNKHYSKRDGSYVYQIVVIPRYDSRTIEYIYHIGKEVSPIPAMQPSPPPVNK